MDERIKIGYIGRTEQLYGVRRLEIAEGRARGSQLIEVYTEGGLQLDILPDSGLDIGQVRYRGRNMTWMSKNGYDGPAAFSALGDEFMHTFSGGLLYTCGLRSAGPANQDGQEYHPLHGRAHGLAAERVSAEIANGSIVVRGTLRETALFGCNLALDRVIEIPTGGSEIRVTDTVTNLSPFDEEYMQIYHCNFGYPLLSESAELLLHPDRQTTPRTAFAKEGLGTECAFETPIPGQEERCYFHRVPDHRAILRNPAIDAQMTLRWSGETLPMLLEWRSMAAGDYALGLEPTNSYIMGRSAERENGTLPVLPAHSSITHTLTFEFSPCKE